MLETSSTSWDSPTLPDARFEQRGAGGAPIAKSVAQITNECASTHSNTLQCAAVTTHVSDTSAAPHVRKLSISMVFLYVFHILSTCIAMNAQLLGATTQPPTTRGHLDDAATAGRPQVHSEGTQVFWRSFCCKFLRFIS